MNPLVIEAELEGFYRMTVTRPDGTQRDTGWFPNLITTSGLNRIGRGGIGAYALVGSGSAVPLITDTALQALVAWTNNNTDSSDGASPVAPYYGWHRRKFRFAAGVAAGNLSEVGIGWSEGDGISPVFSRALIRDSNGDPTTITVLPDEVLDVQYELRLYAPTVDQAFSILVSGMTHNCVARASRVTDNVWSPRYLFEYGSESPYVIYPFVGPIGTVLQGPSGENGQASSPSPNAYANNSMKRSFTGTWPLDQGNLPGGIGAFEISVYYSNLGNFQVSVDPKIMKDSTKILSMNFEVSWSRKT